MHLPIKLKPQVCYIGFFHYINLRKKIDVVFFCTSDLQKRCDELEKSKADLEKLLQEKSKSIEQFIADINQKDEALKKQEQISTSLGENKSNLQSLVNELTSELQDKIKCFDDLENRHKSQENDLQNLVDELKEKLKNLSEQYAQEKEALVEQHKKILLEKE